MSWASPSPLSVTSACAADLPGALQRSVETITGLPGALQRSVETFTGLPGALQRSVETVTGLPGALPRSVETIAGLPGALPRSVETIAGLPGALRRSVEKNHAERRVDAGCHLDRERERDPARKRSGYSLNRMTAPLWMTRGITHNASSEQTWPSREKNADRAPTPYTVQSTLSSPLQGASELELKRGAEAMRPTARRPSARGARAPSSSSAGSCARSSAASLRASRSPPSAAARAE